MKCSAVCLYCRGGILWHCFVPTHVQGSSAGVEVAGMLSSGRQWQRDTQPAMPSTSSASVDRWAHQSTANQLTVAADIAASQDHRQSNSLEGVATNHWQKLQSQDGGLPELLLGYSCLTNHSKAASLWLVMPKQVVDHQSSLVMQCSIPKFWYAKSVSVKRKGYFPAAILWL